MDHCLLMKHYSYNEYDSDHPNGGFVITKSEKEIVEEFYDYWYEKMVKKFGKEHVDANYVKLDCIDDWVTIHWAWESVCQGR